MSGLSMDSYCGAGCEPTGDAVVLRLSCDHEVNVFTIGASALEALQIGAVELYDVSLFRHPKAFPR